MEHKHIGLALLLIAVAFMGGCFEKEAQDHVGTTLSLGLKETIVPNNHLVLGDIYTDNKGMTLYTYARDAEGKSNCQGQCAIDWPPLTVEDIPIPPENAQVTLGVTVREDGRRQVTLDGKPLYYYIEDKNPGDAKGQGKNNEWLAAEIP
ncbi:MAG: hypothetical protein FJY77_05105 [Candidatus Altiarchaeales archaeon]|nr:hypothetical protein [Candidatus Altiarchaeales archaeon]